MSSLGVRIIDGNWVVNSTGNIEVANYLLAKIRLQLKTQLGSWLYNTDIGSQVPQITEQRQNLTRNQYEQIFSAAMLPLEQSGEVINVTIIMDYIGLGYIEVTINCTDSTGAEVKFDYNSKDI